MPRKDGQPCEAPPLSDGYCWTHDPRRSAEEHALAHAKGGIATRARRVEILVDLESRGGIHTFLSDVARAVARGQVGPSAGNTLNALANTALRLIEIEIEARLAALEVGIEEERQRERRRTP